MADDWHNVAGPELSCGNQGVPEQRQTGDFVHNLWLARAHPCAFAGGENHNC
jgi:hypothetical protein